MHVECGYCAGIQFRQEDMLISGYDFGARSMERDWESRVGHMLPKILFEMAGLADRINQMKPSTIDGEPTSEVLDDYQAHAIGEIVHAVRSISFGSVEIVIQNSRIVQIERKEKIRFDRG